MKLIIILLITIGTAWAQPHYEHYNPTPATPYTDSELNFYSRSQPYGEFSNFALFPIFVDGQWWPTSEHYYQAQKYLLPEHRAWVQAAPDPMEAANRGRAEDFPKDQLWDEHKDAVMMKALEDKYTRYETLRSLLLSTGEARLIEHTSNDCYWADCGDGTGKNVLGIMLMEIRAKLKTSSR